VFARVTLRAFDRAASARFYETVLPAIGMEHWSELGIVQADGAAVTRRLHIGFFAPSRDAVEAFWLAGLRAGYRDDGSPGPRPEYSADYYGAFLLDPDGNSAEAVHQGEPGARQIDHLWIRVADVEAARRFYEAHAPQTGFDLHTQLPERVHFKAPSGASFGLVAGPPTESAFLTFAAHAAPFRGLDPDGNTVEAVRL
jgi:catechol 2,3-dioxygenase-like lactoylglutathione lyase family enzyme